MGSQTSNAKLWGRQPKDWAAFQEPCHNSGYDYAIKALQLTGQETLLDVGCGTGGFCVKVAPKVRFITGLDGTVELVEEARRRLPAYPFLVGEMESLPFPDEAYDIVTGFNSFQYAAIIDHALAEARRVLKPKGRLVTMIWGNKEDCQAAISLGAMGRLMPPPPPGTPGPFALSEQHLLERTLEISGFTILSTADVDSIWDYPDIATALRGFLSAGPSAKAMDVAGYDKVVEAVTASLPPFTRGDGHIVYNNKWRVVIAQKE